jgi:hypothetical protein
MATEDGWSSAAADDERVLVEREVLEGASIRVVEREPDGEWVFLDHRRSVEERDLRPVTLAALVAEDPGIGLVADLDPGWLAWRTSRGSDWARVPIADAYHRVAGKDGDHGSDFVFLILDHEPGRLERLWLSLTWRIRRRALRRLTGRSVASPWKPPGPDTNGPSGTGDRVPRRSPDGPLAASVAMPEPTRDGAG